MTAETDTDNDDNANANAAAVDVADAAAAALEQVAATMDAYSVADAVTFAMESQQQQQQQLPRKLPPPLPPGWLLRESRSNPGYYYYYNMETGISIWDRPSVEDESQDNMDQGEDNDDDDGLHDQKSSDLLQPPSFHHHLQDNNAALTNDTLSGNNNYHGNKEELPVAGENDNDEDPEVAPDRSSKRRKETSSKADNNSNNPPKQVRVLHILKKHKDSRRPSSWRQAKITQTLDEAKEELLGLLEIIKEEENNPQELRATFEELARTESDCSSAKRGGDLGFFGKRKMQPNFEQASFALNIGEFTKELVETSSGVHLILRIG